jgi:hypothetical protein
MPTSVVVSAPSVENGSVLVHPLDPGFTVMVKESLLDTDRALPTSSPE